VGEEGFRHEGLVWACYTETKGKCPQPISQLQILVENKVGLQQLKGHK
jgi:hypothetical protein